MRSDISLAIALAAAGAALGFSAGPPSVCLHGQLSVPFEYEHSDAILTGLVVAQRLIPESAGYYEGDGYTVVVHELIRGALPSPFELFSENSSGRFPMEVDSTYLLFVHRERGRLMVDNCGNSARLRVAGAALDTVRQLQRKARR